MRIIIISFTFIFRKKDNPSNLNYLQYQLEASSSAMSKNLQITYTTISNARKSIPHTIYKSLKTSFLRKQTSQTIFQRRQLHLYSKKNQLQNEKYSIQLSSSLLPTWPFRPPKEAMTMNLLPIIMQLVDLMLSNG